MPGSDMPGSDKLNTAQKEALVCTCLFLDAWHNGPGIRIDEINRGIDS